MRASISPGLRVLLLAALWSGNPSVSLADTICVTEIPLAGAGGSGADFGRSVAVDGDLAVVCGDLEAYAYSWNGSVWVQEAILTLPGAESGFGGSAALDGNTALIGLPLQDGPFADSGRALVFVRDVAGAWTLEDELLPLDPALNDQFGFAVALDGERALIGSPRDDPLGVDTGSAYVFERSAATWSQVAKVLPASSASSRFGTTVALSGDTAVIGSALFLGGVFVHVAGGGAWPLQADLAPVLLLPSQVALDGDRAVVGGLFHSLVFERSGTAWTQTKRLEATATTVALDGDVVVLGGASCPAEPAATVFVHDGGDWIESAGLQIEGSVLPVAISGLRVLVGTRGGLACSGGLAAGFLLDLDPPPSVAYRNAGSNPASYSAVSASYGGTLQFTIDLTTTGHALGLVIGFDSPFELTLPGGQTLLCLDLLGSGGELINTGFRLGPQVHFAFPVPNNPDLAGAKVSTQAMHAFGVLPFALSNAQDLVIGGCP